MARLSLRIVGLALMTLAITVSSCQALFASGAGASASPVDSGLSQTSR
jgi:hypothetical protein